MSNDDTHNNVIHVDFIKRIRRSSEPVPVYREYIDDLVEKGLDAEDAIDLELAILSYVHYMKCDETIKVLANNFNYPENKE